MGDAHQISGWLIHKWPSNLTFRPLENNNKTKQNKNFRKFESFRGGFLGNNKPKIGRCLQKNYDDWSISGWEIEERRFRHNIPCAPSPWCCPWGSSDGRNEFSRIYISCILIYKEKKIWRRCSLSSVTLMLFSRISWWLERKVFFTKLVDNREWEMHTKFHDDRTINSWEIEEKRFRHNIPCAPSPWCCSWGSSDGRNEFSFI